MKKITKIIVLTLLGVVLVMCLAACSDGLNGADGKNGTDGLDGADGGSGSSAYEIYISYYPDYTGTEEQWIYDLANGNLVRFTVTFDSNGAGAVNSLFDVRKGTLIGEPAALTKDDYGFYGWYTDEDFTDIWNFNIDTVKADMTLYAKWIAPTDGLEFTLINDGAEYAVTRIGTAIDTDIVIPSTYGNLPVTEIGYDAFRRCTGLTSVVIPNSVKTIGPNAFYDCSNLASVTIGNGVTKISWNAFFYCTSLKSITIPSSVISIGESAFSCCESLTDIAVNENNPHYSAIDGVLFNKDKTVLVCYPAGKTEASYAIPNGVTAIGYEGFYSCVNLTSVIIPNSLTEIGPAAFAFCINLNSMIISNGVESIGWCAFVSCIGLTSIVIPSNVKSIEDGAFFECSGLVSVTIPHSVKNMGVDVFCDCAALKTIHVKGYTEKPDGWKKYWDDGCKATVEWDCQCDE